MRLGIGGLLQRAMRLDGLTLNELEETTYGFKTKGSKAVDRIRINNNDPNRPDRILWMDRHGTWHESQARKASDGT